jgi:Fe-S-cluster containining protein
MRPVQRIVANYRVLCRYCDDYFASIKKLYPDDMSCGRGCDACCVLDSVCALEAHVLLKCLGKKRAARCGAGRGCALLRRSECVVYPVRPVICRTHGLPVSLDGGKTARRTCAKTFAGLDLATLPRQHLFDAALVTANLMRLNVAFCMAAGDKELASKRFTMEQVLRGKVPENIL